MTKLGLDPKLVKRRVRGSNEDTPDDDTPKTMVFISCTDCGRDLVIEINRPTACTQCSRSYHFLAR